MSLESRHPIFSFVYLYTLHTVSTNKHFLSELKDGSVTKGMVQTQSITTSFRLGHRWDVRNWLLGETSDLWVTGEFISSKILYVWKLRWITFWCKKRLLNYLSVRWFSSLTSACPDLKQESPKKCTAYL